MTGTAVAPRRAFARARDASAARLVAEALRFPGVDPVTGYPPVPFNTLARLAGLLRCLALPDEAAVVAEVARLAEAGEAMRVAKDGEGWRALRHARSALESVASDLSVGGRFPASEAEVAATLEAARTVHVPALLRLLEGAEADALGRLLQSGEAMETVPTARLSPHGRDPTRAGSKDGPGP